MDKDETMDKIMKLLIIEPHRVYKRLEVLGRKVLNNTRLVYQEEEILLEDIPDEIKASLVQKAKNNNDKKDN